MDTLENLLGSAQAQADEASLGALQTRRAFSTGTLAANISAAHAAAKKRMEDIANGTGTRTPDTEVGTRPPGS